MQLILDPRRDTEVRTGASQAPEKVRILLRAALQNRPLCGHDLNPGHVVAGKAVLANQPAVASAERQPPNSGSRSYAKRCSQSVLLRCAIELTEFEAGLSPRDSAARVDF